MGRTTLGDSEEIPRALRWRHACARLALLAVALAPALVAASHPSLWYTAPDRQQLRDRKAGTHAPIYDALRRGAEYFLGSTVSSSGRVTWPGTSRTFELGDRRDIGNALVVFAFVSDLADDVSYFALAHDWLIAVAGFGGFNLDGAHDLVQSHLLAGVAVAYDILAPSLSAQERALVLTSLATNANQLMDAGRSGIWWEREFLQNHNWINHAAVGLAALTALDDLPSSTTTPWLDYASENARSVKVCLDGVSDGTWHEGFSYAAYGLSWHLPFLVALERRTGIDLGDLALVRAHGSARAHVQLPNAANRYIVTNGDFYGFSADDDLVVLRYGASRFNDGIAQAVADGWVSSVTASTYGPELSQRVFEYLFYDPTVASANLRSLSPDWFGGDLQAAVFRSGFGPTDLAFALKSGAFGGVAALNRIINNEPPIGGLNFSHDHADDNGFYFYGNGSWLAPEAAGYYIGHPDSPGPQANRAVFHNTLLVDDAGQLGEGVRQSGDEHGAYGWFTQRSGRISVFASTDDFAYAVGEGAQLYPASIGLSGWSRQVLFLDRRWIVLRDVVHSNQPHLYTWLCHFMEGVSREGNWLHGQGRDGQALGIAVLSPTQWQLSVEQQSPVNISRLNPSGSVYAAKVATAASASDVTFLTALVPSSEAAWNQRPMISALDSAQPEGGLRVTLGPHSSAALFNDSASGSRSIAGMQLDGLAGVIDYLDGSPSRVVLIRAAAIGDIGGTVASQPAATGAFEADGLGTESVFISGDLSPGSRIFAPMATRVLRNGADAPFSREGAFIVVGDEHASTDGGDPISGPDGGVSRAADAGLDPDPNPIATGPTGAAQPGPQTHGAAGCSSGAPRTSVALSVFAAAMMMLRVAGAIGARVRARRRRRGSP